MGKKVYLVDIISGDRKNITEGYVGHADSGIFDVKVQYKKSLRHGIWIDDVHSTIHEDCYVEFG